MWWLSIGILLGIYLDQTFTIPPLNEYTKIIMKMIEEGRRKRLKTQPDEKKD
jgi:hypothetical protein